MLFPRLLPILIPDRIKSGLKDNNDLFPIFTQSAGVPETAKPLNPSSRSISFTYSGLDIVIP